MPKNSKSLPILKWTVAFQDFLYRALGARYIPLTHVICDPATPAAIGVQARHKPYFNDHGSVEAELIARAWHDHALY